MKKLFIMRHAHAQAASKEGDKARPLSQRGMDEAHAQATYVQSRERYIDRVLVSSAKRTQETAHILAQSIEFKEFLVRDSLYESSYEHILDSIDECEDEIESLMVVAHNPSVSQLAGYFLGLYTDLPPATLIELHFDTKKWEHIARESLLFESVKSPIEH